MSAIIPLGKLASEDAGRDAIHVAVAPVVAAENLSIGQHVGIAEDGRASAKAKPIGIVDPYLKGFVEAGQRFYLCLYPNTITSLRHHWVHPAFKDEGPAEPEKDVKAASEAWLRQYAHRTYSVEYFNDSEEAYRTLLSDMRSGTLTYRGIDMHSREDLIDGDELRLHAQIVLGITINYDNFEYFSCTC